MRPCGSAAGARLLLGVMAAMAAMAQVEYRRVDPFAGLDIECDDRERECFADNKIWFPSDSRCHSLLQQGPCGADEWVVVSKARLRVTVQGRARVRGACVRLPWRECPPGRVLMAHDQHCHPRALAERRLCGAQGLQLVFDAFGEGSCASGLPPPLPPLPRPALRAGACVARGRTASTPLTTADVEADPAAADAAPAGHPQPFPSPAFPLYALQPRSSVDCARDNSNACAKPFKFASPKPEDQLED